MIRRGLATAALLCAGATMAACSALLGIEDVGPIQDGADSSVGSPSSSSGSEGGSGGGMPGSGGSGGSGGGGTAGAGGGAPPTCDDGVQNGIEEGVDCGGECGACPGASCENGTTCASGFCADDVCCNEPCTDICHGCDGDRTTAESGTCAPVLPATDPQAECQVPSGDACNGLGACQCFDGIQNGLELGVDCGPSCSMCGGTCTDGIHDNGESDVDCGGPNCPPCAAGKNCAAHEHCVDGACNGGTCCIPEDEAVTCATKCGNTTNNCGQPVACGTTCVPQVPGGWVGPSILYVGPASQAAPPCPPGYPTLALDASLDLLAPPAMCSACVCGAPSDEACSGAGLSLHLLAGCSSQQFAGGSGIGGCNSGPSVIGANSATAYLIGTAGTCPPATGGVATLPGASFAQAARVCTGSVGQGCSNGHCVAEPPAEYGSKACVYQAGDVSCPQSYPEQTVVYGGLGVDSRGCTACGCDYVSGTCTGHTVLHSNDICTSGVATVPNNGQCTNLGGGKNVNSFTISATGPPTGGSCEPTGGMATGTVVGDGPTTVCCEQ